MLGLAPAPELQRDDGRWFNVSRPLCLADLRGRLIILDFWTSCCVNCLHVLPTLRRIEELFSDSVLVIGVHSPKYPAEQDAANVAHAIARHNIRHPVVHDPQLSLWQEYGIAAWPTLVFIGPDGHILGDLPGEPATEKLISGIGEMIRCWRASGSICPRPLPLDPDGCAPAAGRFRFPAKIKPLHRPGASKLWAIADSGHHQVVICDDDGREIRRFGCGTPGFLDLADDACAFNSPQGLACNGSRVYVADTGNHAIRRIDLETGTVCTVAGTGERGPVLECTRRGRDAQLASVWDLEYADGTLFFANAGTHQLGRIDLGTDEVVPLAGTGDEDLVDGVAREAQLAQPTGLALDAAARILYFVDSETSSVRAIDIADGGRVRTLVGAGLFECGRRNGAFAHARLQHCRGITCWRDRLVVADSYNGILRILDLRARQVSELGGEDCCWANDQRLKGGDPAGVTADGDHRLLVADTNHHRLVEMTVGDDLPSARVWSA
jgi:thiol-disulfide isomerase/thioredoxin